MRTLLLVTTNFAVVLTLAVLARALGLDNYITQSGLNFTALLGFSAVIGFGGAAFSLFFSIPLAKLSTGAEEIKHIPSPRNTWLHKEVRDLARAAGIPMPRVAIYRGAPNAFATGRSRNNSMIAVSSGLLDSLSPEDVRAVLAHEIAHVSNGDMVTLSLLQGVINTFVLFLSRAIGFAVDKLMGGDERRQPGVGFSIATLIFDILFGILGSLVVMAFSRRREYRADAGAAELLGTPLPMITALQKLAGLPSDLPQGLAAFGVSGARTWLRAFSSHPGLEDRIARLYRWKQS